MPKIETIKRADGSQRYRFTIDVGHDPVTGKRRQRRYTFARMKDARAELGRLTGAVADGTFTDRTRETVADALDAYLASACFERADNTRVSYTNALLPVRERLGRHKLQSLTRTDIEDLRDWMLDVRAQARRDTRHAPRGAVGAADARPAQGRSGDGLRGWSTGRQPRPVRAAACSDQTGGHHVVRAEVAARSWPPPPPTGCPRAGGCPRTACAAARSSGCGGTTSTSTRGTVTIGRARVLVDGRVIVKTPKSERGYRTLPLDGALAGALRALHMPPGR